MYSAFRIVLGTAIVGAIAFASIARPQGDSWWLNIQLKARSMLVDPAVAGDLHEVLDDDISPGVTSPDGKRVLFVGSDPERVKAGHDFDLFVADVDSARPSGKGNVRRVTTDQAQPHDAHWSIDGAGITFLAGEETSTQVWYVDLSPDSIPVRLSDGKNRCRDLAVLADGRIAWLAHTGSKGKQQFVDLLIHPSPATTGKMQTALTGEHISSYAFSPDAKRLAWSGLGSLFIVDMETKTSREIPLQGVHRQLLNHTAHEIAWRPDGRIIAIRCGFLGGIARAFNADPNEPWPRMFAEDKIFFIPANWTPSPESLKVGEGAEFPSPTADDPNAEISPPAGDESKPWWVRGLPMRSLGMKWIIATEAQARIASSKK